MVGLPQVNQVETSKQEEKAQRFHNLRIEQRLRK